MFKEGKWKKFQTEVDKLRDEVKEIKQNLAEEKVSKRIKEIEEKYNVIVKFDEKDKYGAWETFYRCGLTPIGIMIGKEYAPVGTAQKRDFMQKDWQKILDFLYEDAEKNICYILKEKEIENGKSRNSKNVERRKK